MKMLDHEKTLERLAHATWAPSDMRYLLSISQRLNQLAKQKPELLHLLGLTHQDLEALPDLIKRDADLNPGKLTELAIIAKSPANPASDKVGKFPLRGIMELIPGYSLLITKLPDTSPLNEEFELLVSDVFFEIIKAHLSQSYQAYELSRTQIFCRENKSHNPNDPDLHPPFRNKLIVLSQAARKVVSNLSYVSPDELTEIEHATWSTFEKSCKNFVKNLHKPPKKTTKTDDALKPKPTGKPRKPNGNRYHSDASATHMESPLELKALEVVSDWPDDEQVDKVVHLITVEHKAEALSDDLSPYELVEEDWDVGTELNEFVTPQAIKMAGQYQAKQFSNAAQLLRWSTSNLTPSAIELLVSSLQQASKPHTKSGLAASLVMASLVTGRPLESIFPVGLHIDNAETFQEPDQKDVIAVFLPKMQAIAIRVNQSSVRKIYEWSGIHERKSFILVPDYLDVSALLNRFANVINSKSKSTLSNNEKQIQEAARTVVNQLSINAANASKVWQLLPRIMQSESGMYTGMAMLTGWQSANSSVDLHYHTVPSKLLSRRYMSAMKSITNTRTFRKLEQSLSTQTGYVGSPNCPTDKAILDVITQFKIALMENKNDIIASHNLKCLYTLMLCTAGFGLRHSIRPKFKVSRFKSICWLSYVEKGQHRQLQLPKIIDEQLRSFDAHLGVMSARKIVKSQLKDDRKFFLLDPHNETRILDFKPSDIEAYLEPYGIHFKLPLNSLRRWMFSQQFIAGVRGIGTDFYGGHGVRGRMPLSDKSSTRLAVYMEAAKGMDQILKNAGWEVL